MIPSDNDLPLRCPCPRKAELRRIGDDHACTREGCPHASPPDRFPTRAGIPIVVSTLLCDTVCDPGNVASYIPRSAQPGTGLLSGLFLRERGVTPRNARTFVARVKEFSPAPRVLVIGAGERGYGTSELWDDPVIGIHGVDVYSSPTVDLVCDAHYLPLADAYYDGVWIQAVLEHVVDPGQVVAEIFRVLKPGGIVYAETPFMQQVHEGAYDFTRFTVLGHRYLFRRFRLLEMGGVSGPEVALAWSFRHFVWALTRSRRLGRLAGMVLGSLLRPMAGLMAPASMFDASSATFFLGAKDGTTVVTHKELVTLYRGQFAPRREA